jgi:hypothetical protein
MHVTLLRYEGLDPPWHSQRRIRPKLAIHSQSPHCAPNATSAETPSEYCLSLWRSSGEILNHGCKSLRSNFHRAGERIVDCHNGQQAGKD